MPLRHLPMTKPAAAPKAGDSEAFKEVAVAHESRHVSGEFLDDVEADGKDEETSKTVALVGVAAKKAMLGSAAPEKPSKPGAALIPLAVSSAIGEVRAAVEEILDVQQLMTNEDFKREDEKTRRIADERARAMAETMRETERRDAIARREFHKKNLLARRELKKRKELAEAAAQKRAAEQGMDHPEAFRAFEDAAANVPAARQAPIAGPGSQARKRSDRKRLKPVGQAEIADAQKDAGQEYEDLALFGSIADRFAHDQEGGLAYLAAIRAAKMNARERALLLRFVETEGMSPENALEKIQSIQRVTPASPKPTRKIA